MSQDNLIALLGQVAGSEAAQIFRDFLRPRVRKKEPNGSTTEVPLKTYEIASDPEELQQAIITALSAGVSTRELKNLHPKVDGTSRSNVSRLWQEAGEKFVSQHAKKNRSRHTLPRGDKSSVALARVCIDGSRKRVPKNQSQATKICPPW